MPEPTPTSRTCTKCLEEKSLDDFHRDKSQKHGRHPVCKPCKRQAIKELRARDPEATRAAQRAYRAANLERIQEQERKRVRTSEDPEVVRQRRASWAAKNADHVRAQRRAYYEANKSQILERTNRWHRENAERAAELRRQWVKNNPNKVADARHRRRAALQSPSGSTPIDFESIWTGSCGICGEQMVRALKWPDPMSPSLDHIVPLSKGGLHALENVQWAHLICNCRKGAKLRSV